MPFFTVGELRRRATQKQIDGFAKAKATREAKPPQNRADVLKKHGWVHHHYWDHNTRRTFHHPDLPGHSIIIASGSHRYDTSPEAIEKRTMWTHLPPEKEDDAMHGIVRSSGKEHLNNYLSVLHATGGDLSKLKHLAMPKEEPMHQTETALVVKQSFAKGVRKTPVAKPAKPAVEAMIAAVLAGASVRESYHMSIDPMVHHMTKEPDLGKPKGRERHVKDGTAICQNCSKPLYSSKPIACPECGVVQKYNENQYGRFGRPLEPVYTCKNCDGRPIPKGATNCPGCGANVPTARTESMYRGDGKKKPWKNPKLAAGPIRNKDTEWYHKGSKVENYFFFGPELNEIDANLGALGPGGQGLHGDTAGRRGYKSWKRAGQGDSAVKKVAGAAIKLKSKKADTMDNVKAGAARIAAGVGLMAASGLVRGYGVVRRLARGESVEEIITEFQRRGFSIKDPQQRRDLEHTRLTIKHGPRTPAEREQWMVKQQKIADILKKHGITGDHE